METILGFSWFILLQMILSFVVAKLKFKTAATRQISYSEVVGFPSGFT